MSKKDVLLFTCYGKSGSGKSYMEHLKAKDKEIERLNKKIEQYENPEDMTLMFMWCDEKAKDEIKRLNNIINEFDKLIKNEINESKLEDDYERVDSLEYCLATLKELKGSESNE